MAVRAPSRARRWRDRPSRRTHGASGFTLMELLVTILIAAVFFAAAVPLFANAMKGTSSDIERVAAQAIAQQKIEQIRELQFDQLVNLRSTSGTDLTTWMGGAFNPTVMSYVGTTAMPYNVTYTYPTAVVSGSAATRRSK